ncbi:MAG: ABC transporter ATP-binding protein [Thermoleophilia bacterium]
MTAPLLEVEGLDLRFGEIAAAQNLCVTVATGEIVGIVGPNGAGKTTFINLITGYLRPERGAIRLAGRDLVGRRPDAVTRLGVARSFQIPQLFFNLTVLENILVGLAATEGRSLDPWRPLLTDQRMEKGRRALAHLGLGDLAHRPASELPEGGRKLLDVALALVLEPRLLLLDEPTSGVSVEEKFEVMEQVTKALRVSAVTTMFVEHDMEVVRRFADRVLVLADGRFIADGEPAVVLADPEIRRAVSGRS